MVKMYLFLNRSALKLFLVHLSDSMKKCDSKHNELSFLRLYQKVTSKKTMKDKAGILLLILPKPIE